LTRKLIIGIDSISEAGVCLDLHLTKIGTSFLFGGRRSYNLLRQEKGFKYEPGFVLRGFRYILLIM
jgi:hypothetical protein